MQINELRDKAYKTACEKGWYDKPKSDKHYLMMVIVELSEAIQADRNVKIADKDAFEIDINDRHDWRSEERRFIKIYEAEIKDTVEEELADACLRLLSFAGYKGIDIKLMEYVGESDGSILTESIFDAISTMFNVSAMQDIDYLIGYMLFDIFTIAKKLDIDLLWHIEQKMKYNETRPKMHGKAY